MKDMASAQRERDIHHHITGGTPWVGRCGQGRARPVVAGGSPCPGWAELLAGNLNPEGLLKSSSPGFGPVGWSLLHCFSRSQPMGAMSAARSQPSISPRQAMTRSQPKGRAAAALGFGEWKSHPKSPGIYQGACGPCGRRASVQQVPSQPPIVLVRGPCGPGPYRGHPGRLTGSGENWRGEEVGSRVRWPPSR